MVSENNQDSLTAAFVDDQVIIRVDGRGSFKISPALKQFIHQVIAEKSAHTILIDMSECIGMDSTFMGILAGLSSYLKKNVGPCFQLTHLSEKNEKLLITLGVDKVVQYEMGGTSATTPSICASMAKEIKAKQTDRLTTAETTLKAHEKLVEINPDNLAKFQSVLEFLKTDVHNLRR